MMNPSSFRRGKKESITSGVVLWGGRRRGKRTGHKERKLLPEWRFPPTRRENGGQATPSEGLTGGRGFFSFSKRPLRPLEKKRKERFPFSVEGDRVRGLGKRKIPSPSLAARYQQIGRRAPENLR